MGMTDGQVLRQVELPLAMGVIVTGIRYSPRFSLHREAA